MTHTTNYTLLPHAGRSAGYLLAAIGLLVLLWVWGVIERDMHK